MPPIEFDTTLPSIRQIQNWIKQKTTVQFKLITGDTITARIFWQDVNCICVVDSQDDHITINRLAIVYLKVSHDSNPPT